MRMGGRIKEGEGCGVGRSVLGVKKTWGRRDGIKA